MTNTHTPSFKKNIMRYLISILLFSLVGACQHSYEADVHPNSQWRPVNPEHQQKTKK